MVEGLLLDCYGNVAEAWQRAFELIAEGPPFRPLRDSALASLAAVMTEVGCDGDPATLCAAQFASWRSPPLRPGSRAFLASVPVPVGVVSDADRNDLDAAMAHHGLTFDAVVCSEDVGAYKPDRAMFDAALGLLGLAPHQVVHVGDSLRSDVAGAHAAGIRAGWVNRLGRPATDGALAAFVLTDLSDLAATIGRPLPAVAPTAS